MADRLKRAIVRSSRLLVGAVKTVNEWRAASITGLFELSASMANHFEKAFLRFRYFIGISALVYALVVFLLCFPYFQGQ